MFNIPDEVQAVIDRDIPINSTRRVLHEECSQGKNAALSIKRTSEGFVFQCFRCGWKGFIGTQKIPISLLKSQLKAMGRVEMAEQEALRIPYGSLPMSESHDEIPIEAYRWLWDAGLTDDMILHYDLMYCPDHETVIIPIKDGDKLVGYLERFVSNPELGRYKLIKQAGLDRRIYFDCDSCDSPYYTIGQDRVVVVEDPLSAMRVNFATGFATRALLNTTIGSDTLCHFKDHFVTLWLDPGQLQNVVENVARASVYGIDMDYVSTPKDPKCYNNLAIRQFLCEGGDVD